MFCKDEITYNSIPEAHTVSYKSSSWVLLETLNETIYIDNDLTIAWQLMTHTKLWYMGHAITPLHSQSTDMQYKNQYGITCMEAEHKGMLRCRYS